MNAVATSNGFEVSLEVFAGPIDLLLHLVKRRELPLESISLALVAQQYLECVEVLTKREFEAAGEYLVIAATLLSLKARYLLGEDKVEERDVAKEDDEDGEDPHDELLRQLREAELFRRTATELGGRALFGVDVFASPGISMPEMFAAPLRRHDPLSLGAAFQKVLERAKGRAIPFVITVDALSIADRMMMVLAKVDERGGEVSFLTLFDEDEDFSSLIASFLALLELCKRSALVVRQESAFAEITVARPTVVEALGVVVG